MRFCTIALVCCFLFLICVDADNGTFRLESSEWRDGGTVPVRNLFNGSGCNGGNISPAFHWSGAPKGTRSFAITIYDPDAPAPGGWWHWVVFNIPSAMSNIPAGAGDKGSGKLPSGSSQCKNDYGEPGYGGPCPPPGTTHRYVVKIYALDVDRIPGSAETAPGRAAKLVQEHSIGSSQLTVSFGR
jgi:Raf kinase inhibitor-like YbhB/YbcL family protein